MCKTVCKQVCWQKYLLVNPLMRLINDLISMTAYGEYVMLSILAFFFINLVATVDKMSHYWHIEQSDQFSAAAAVNFDMIWMEMACFLTLRETLQGKFVILPILQCNFTGFAHSEEYGWSVTLILNFERLKAVVVWHFINLFWSTYCPGFQHGMGSFTLQ